MNIIDYYFHQGSPGSFEFNIFNAWLNAGTSNRHRLEDAFHEFFPLARMYGNEDGFLFTEFPTYESLQKSISNTVVLMNEWGHTKEAVKLPWSKICLRTTADIATGKTRSFEIRDRSFGEYYPDGDKSHSVPCLCFRDNRYTHNNLWYVTNETLGEIHASVSGDTSHDNHQ